MQYYQGLRHKIVVAKIRNTWQHYIHRDHRMPLGLPNIIVEKTCEIQSRINRQEHYKKIRSRRQISHTFFPASHGPVKSTLHVLSTQHDVMSQSKPSVHCAPSNTFNCPEHTELAHGCGVFATQHVSSEQVEAPHGIDGSGAY